MTKTSPTLSIGMPVFNGEEFLERTLFAILHQTLQDLELVISDNGSTDGTADICQRFASSDSRVRYFRQASNTGAGPNYNFVFAQSCGRYFKWATHDDFMDSNALEACIAALENDRGAVLAHPLLVDVDSTGAVLKECDRGEQGIGPVDQRFWSLMDGSHNCAEIFGVIRTDVLKPTKLIRDYTDSDRTLLGELALRGKLLQVSSVRFYRRVHPGKSDRRYSNYWDRAEWFNPKNRGKVVLSAWRQVGDWVYAVMTAPLTNAEKSRCLYRLVRMAKWKWRLYVQELHWAATKVLRSSQQPKKE